MRHILENEDALNQRIFQFPTSAVKLDGRKINYYNFLTKAENADCNAAVERIYSRLDMAEIDQFIEKLHISATNRRHFINGISVHGRPCFLHLPMKWFWQVRQGTYKGYIPSQSILAKQAWGCTLFQSSLKKCH